jgi:hypothetical protein
MHRTWVIRASFTFLIHEQHYVTFIWVFLKCLGDRASLNSKWRRIPTRYNNGGLLIFNIINISSTCFGCLYTHHQEGRSCCVLLPVVLCSGCSCDVFTVTRMLPAGSFLVTVNTSLHPPRRNHHSYKQNTTPLAATLSPICPPDDGCKGTQNMLRKYW